MHYLLLDMNAYQHFEQQPLWLQGGIELMLKEHERLMCTVPHPPTNTEMVSFLNSHHPGNRFSGKTFWDYRGHSGYLEIVYVNSRSNLKRLRKLPDGYKFDSINQMIIPDEAAGIDNENWPQFFIINTAHPKGILIKLVEKLLNHISPAV